MKKIIITSSFVLLAIFFVSIYAVDSASLNINARILSSTGCGNGIVDIGESCDNGVNNGSCPQTCSLSCSYNCCGGGCGTTYVYCNDSCDVNPCVSGLFCFADPVLGNVCRNSAATSSASCIPDGSVVLNVYARPEKRTPFGNPSYVLPSTLEIRNTGSVSVITSTKFILESNGWGQAVFSSSSFPVLPGEYDVAIKGISHLRKISQKVNIKGDGNDKVLYYTSINPFYLLAGDVQIAKDNYVNGLDLSAMDRTVYSNDIDADLNWDSSVNGLDFSIAVENIYKLGDK